MAGGHGMGTRAWGHGRETWDSETGGKPSRGCQHTVVPPERTSRSPACPGVFSTGHRVVLVPLSSIPLLGHVPQSPLPIPEDSTTALCCVLNPSPRAALQSPICPSLSMCTQSSSSQSKRTHEMGQGRRKTFPLPPPHADH